jgi:hypothetical protein
MGHLPETHMLVVRLIEILENLVNVDDEIMNGVHKTVHALTLREVLLKILCTNRFPDLFVQISTCDICKVSNPYL